MELAVITIRLQCPNEQCGAEAATLNEMNLCLVELSPGLTLVLIHLPLMCFLGLGQLLG